MNFPLQQQEQQQEQQQHPSTAAPNELLLPPDFQPTDRDVICGRARENYHHDGNTYFRDLITKSIGPYLQATTKAEKTDAIASIVNLVQKASPNGGFVKRDSKSERYFRIKDAEARDKVGHAIRKAVQRLADLKPKTLKRLQRDKALALPTLESLTSTSANDNTNVAKLPAVLDEPKVAIGSGNQEDQIIAQPEAATLQKVAMPSASEKYSGLNGTISQNSSNIIPQLNTANAQNPVLGMRPDLFDPNVPMLAPPLEYPPSVVNDGQAVPPTTTTAMLSEQTQQPSDAQLTMGLNSQEELLRSLLQQQQRQFHNQQELPPNSQILPHFGQAQLQNQPPSNNAPISEQRQQALLLALYESQNQNAQEDQPAFDASQENRET